MCYNLQCTPIEEKKWGINKTGIELSVIQRMAWTWMRPSWCVVNEQKYKANTQTRMVHLQRQRNTFRKSTRETSTWQLCSPLCTRCSGTPAPSCGQDGNGQTETLIGWIYIYIYILQNQNFYCNGFHLEMDNKNNRCVSKLTFVSTRNDKRK